MQPCKHFAHKITVEYDEARGRADFPFGVCRMEADGEALSMRCEAPDAEALKRRESVVGAIRSASHGGKPTVTCTAGSRRTLAPEGRC